MKRQSILINWKLIDRGSYYALQGTVLNDDRFPDEESITTSMLLRIDFEKGIAETRNTIYEIR